MFISTDTRILGRNGLFVKVHEACGFRLAYREKDEQPEVVEEAGLPRGRTFLQNLIAATGSGF
jgi:hypothetical protein